MEGQIDVVRKNEMMWFVAAPPFHCSLQKDFPTSKRDQENVRCFQFNIWWKNYDLSLYYN